MAANAEATIRGTQATLLEVLDALLRLLHPIMPFITEELWQRLTKSGDTLMTANWPQYDATQEDADAVAAMDWVKGFILGVRRIRGEMDLSPAKHLPVLIQDAGATDRAFIEQFGDWLKFLARIESIEIVDDAPSCATALLGKMKILVPMAGLIDKDAELARLGKQIEKLEKDLSKSTAKLENKNFVANAPDEVVAKERARIAEMEAARAELTAQREKIALL